MMDLYVSLENSNFTVAPSEEERVHPIIHRGQGCAVINTRGKLQQTLPRNDPPALCQTAWVGHALRVSRQTPEDVIMDSATTMWIFARYLQFPYGHNVGFGRVSQLCRG